MKFSKPMADVTAKAVPSGRTRPVEGFYTMHIVKAEDTVSKAGNKMLVLHLDITDGPFAGFFNQNPLRYYRPYQVAAGNPNDSDDFMAATKRDLESVQESNAGLISEDDINANDFDESRLVGLIVGACLGRKESNGFLEVKFLTTVAAAKKKAETVDIPNEAPVAENNPMDFIN